MIKAQNIHKSFGSLEVLKGVSLEVSKGEVVAIVGASGAGKTTLLQILGTLSAADEGRLEIDGVEVSGLNDKALSRFRNEHIGFVFQFHHLLPEFTALENVCIPAYIARRDRAEVEARARELLDMMGLAERLDHKPAQLSGGEQQRVAIARALINKPRVLLLDEPLGALDLKLRKDMQNELKKIQTQTGITFIYVTHDQEEALSMSDTVVVMQNGVIQQIGTPTDIYNEPVNAFVADFIGESNIVDGIMLEDCLVSFSGHTFTCVDGGYAKNQPVDVVVRPEDVDVVKPEDGMLRGCVSSVTFKGVHYEIIVDIDGFKWMIQTTDYVAPEQEIGLYLEPDAIHIMKKSEFSGQFGDYSSYSDEMDEISNPDASDEE